MHDVGSNETNLNEAQTNEANENRTKDEISRSDLETFLAEAVRAARVAGDLLLEKRGQVGVEFKAGHADLVTEADRKAEAAVIDVLRGAFPLHGIIGEESGELPGTDGYRWLVDPLDGTTNYAHGLPLFGTSIGLERNGELLVGVLHFPVLERTYSATRGSGAWCNGERLHVSTAGDLKNSLLVTGHSHSLGAGVRENLDLLNMLVSASRGVRMLGSAAINLAYIAEGLFEAYWAPTNEVWDVAAGVLIVEEAGGKVTDMAGGELDLFRPRLLATNGLVHDDMLQALRPGAAD